MYQVEMGFGQKYTPNLQSMREQTKKKKVNRIGNFCSLIGRIALPQKIIKPSKAIWGRISKINL